MPGLIRGVARTAVVAGTATAVSNRVSRRQAGRWADENQAQQQQMYASQPAYAEPPPQYQQPQTVYVQAAPTPAAEAAQPPADAMSDKLAQLQQLGELKTQGILTEAEFEAQKAKILNS
ncbi:MAG: SHOCT domain-containing protein [Chloroflexi bacterium]|nr:SHOCT domain-containing protein [Chloroflexota bacterium]